MKEKNIMKNSDFLNKLQKEKCSERIKTAQMFNLELRSFLNKINLSEIDIIRKGFKRYEN